MALNVVRKLDTARRVFRSQGLKGVVNALTKEQDSWWVGKFVELRGDTVELDGCSFSLHSPAIATTQKSSLFFGRYEAPEREVLMRFLDPELPVVELGGALGVVACLTNKRLKRPDRHVVVEANPEMLPLLRENRDRNGCGFAVVHGAVAYGAPEVVFYQNEDFSGSSALVAAARTVTVPTVSLRGIVDGYGFERCTLICDIEGSESELVAREEEVLARRVAGILIEVHGGVLGREGFQEVLERIERIGFTKAWQQGETCFYRNAALSAAVAGEAGVATH